MNRKQSQQEMVTIMTEEFSGGLEELQIAYATVQGTRGSQQDALYGYKHEKGVLGIVCDGMGGLAGGERASKTAMEHFVEDFYNSSDEITADIPSFLQQEAIYLDEKVHSLKNEAGQPLAAGTTMVAVVIRDKKLFWISVGDSRIYLIRHNQIEAKTKDHNYQLYLDNQLLKGEITPEKFKAEQKRGEALISFLGMGDMSLMDYNATPFLLEPDDMILLCSDGLYKGLSEKEILRILKEPKQSVAELADELTRQAEQRNPRGQDNTSVVLIEYQEVFMEDKLCQIIH